MITYNDLGKKGRLGNQLFEIASTIGIALANGTNYGFPKWQYDPFFVNRLPVTDKVLPDVKEEHYHFTPIHGKDINVQGWLQSPKYWKGFENIIRAQFTFTEALKDHVKAKVNLPHKPTIAISIRRGDFVNNQNYQQVPIRFYILALIENFKNYKDCNIVLFSDDIDYCKVHFECLPNAYFCEKMTSIEQLCLMSMCDHYIISNSTFSWWGAYLGSNPDKVVIRPPKAMAGKLSINDERDYWPPEWTVLNYHGRKIPLADFTFTIPVFKDHDDRSKNLHLSVKLLEQDFDTHIVIGEQGSHAFQNYDNYVKFDYDTFHRTKMLNQMALTARTPFVANWDCDIMLPPMQVVLAAELLRSGEADMCYPYDGRFARMPRGHWYTPINQYSDIGIVGGTIFKGKNEKPMPVSSVGGVVFVNKAKFIESGMENEYMISFCPEDCERWDRWHMLGYNVKRTGGTVYHMDHYIGINSSSKNPFWKAGHDLLDQIRLMDKTTLRNFVETWPWVKKLR